MHNRSSSKPRSPNPEEGPSKGSETRSRSLGIRKWTSEWARRWNEPRIGAVGLEEEAIWLEGSGISMELKVLSFLLQREGVDGVVWEIKVGHVPPYSCFVFGRTENFFGFVRIFYLYGTDTRTRRRWKLELEYVLYYQNHMQMSLSLTVEIKINDKKVKDCSYSISFLFQKALFI